MTAAGFGLGLNLGLVVPADQDPPGLADLGLGDPLMGTLDPESSRDQLVDRAVRAGLLDVAGDPGPNRPRGSAHERASLDSGLCHGCIHLPRGPD